MVASAGTRWPATASSNARRRSSRAIAIPPRVCDRARISWTWAFVLTPLHGGSATRLVFRWRACTSPWWLTTSHDMLHGLRARVVRRGIDVREVRDPSGQMNKSWAPSVFSMKSEALMIPSTSS